MLWRSKDPESRSCVRCWAESLMQSENSDFNSLTDSDRIIHTFLFYELSEIHSSLIYRIKNSTLREHLFINDTDESANESCDLTVTESRHPDAVKSIASSDAGLASVV